MAPSAPLPLPPSPPLTAFLEGDGTVHPSNGHDNPCNIPPAQSTQPKLPGKSNLKRHSMFSSLQLVNHQVGSMGHLESFVDHIGNRVDPTDAVDKDRVTASGYESSPGDGADVVVGLEADYDAYKRKDCRVTWTDNHGQDLTEIWEFEPSDTGDSDEESDSDSTQACTCVIQ